MTKFEIFVTLYACVTLPVVAWVWALFRAATKPTPKPDRDKILLNALNKTLDDYHAKRGTFAEGRPTMPSEVEPELEMERRTR